MVIICLCLGVPMLVGLIVGMRLVGVLWFLWFDSCLCCLFWYCWFWLVLV